MTGSVRGDGKSISGPMRSKRSTGAIELRLGSGYGLLSNGECVMSISLPAYLALVVCGLWGALELPLVRFLTWPVDTWSCGRDFGWWVRELLRRFVGCAGGAFAASVVYY